MNKRKESKASKTKLYLNISKKVMQRLNDISDIENIPKYTMMEKIIMAYIPTPPTTTEGEFIPIHACEIKRHRKTHPDAIYVSVSTNMQNGTLLGLPYRIWLQYKGGEISWDMVKRLYLERLQLPDAQARIEELKKYKKTQNVYVASFESDEEHSMRKVFMDYITGKLIWK